jgi:hypothetical protein
MRTRVTRAVLAALLLLLSTGWAAAQGRAYEKLPQTHWAYDSVRRLEREGYSTGSPEGAFTGRPPRTRFEFAVAVERMYRSLQPRVLAASEPGSLPRDLRVFRRLLDEFGGDISDLGPDVAEIRQQLRSMEERLQRLQRSEEAGQPAEGAALLGAAHLYGLGGALQASLLPDLFSGNPATLDRGTELSLKPGIGTGLAVAYVEADPPSILERTTWLPLEDPASRFSIRTGLARPVGRALISAFYNREGGLSDRFGRSTPYLSGPTESVGGEISGTVSGVRVHLQGGGIRVQDGNLGGLFVGGGFNYRLGGGFSIGGDYQRTLLTRQGGVLSAYTLGLAKSFGANARLGMFLRYFDTGSVNSNGGSGDFGGSSAITQLSVRF